jgi:hypothetical protein
MFFRLFVLGLLLCFVGTSDALAQKSKKRPAPRVKTGQLVLTVTTEGADVQVDGASVGASPLPGPLTLPVGVHALKVTKDGYAEYLDTVKIGTNETSTVEVDLLPFKAVLSLASSPPGVDVQIDGQLVGQTPLKHEVDAGEHVIRMGLDGYHDAEKALRVEAGKSYEVSLELVALPPPPRKAAATSRPIYKTWWFWAGTGVIAVGATVLIISATSSDDPLGSADRVIDIEF